MAMNKFQRLTFQPRRLKFYMKTPYNNLAKIYANSFGHLTKMADMPIYGKKPLKIIFRTRRLVTLGLGINIWDVGPIKFVEMMILG